jgi:amino acid adenylation domain-containing protein
LAPAREENRLPLTDIQFNLERLAEGLDLPGLDVRVEPNPKAFVNFDLFCNVIESNDGLRIDCDYNSALYDAATIDYWLGRYRTTLEAFARDTTVAVDAIAYEPRDLPVVSLAESAAAASAREATLPALFEARAAERPGDVAAICGERRLSYAELDERANRLANYLTARLEPGNLVGILLDRSLDMLIALLAVAKAGCAYVPLDPRHPASRLRHIFEDAGVALLLVDDAAGAGVVPGGVPFVSLEDAAAGIAASPADPPGVRARADDLAYVIYTSGSTGLPKGVEISHRSLANLLESVAQRPGMTARDVLLAVTTISFDIAALELFLPLIVGGTVAIASSDETADGFRLLERLRRSQATLMQATPSLWRVLLEAGFRSEPGFVALCGGEPLRDDVANRLLEHGGALWNMYGPTETTIWSSCAKIERGRPVTVGTPVAGTQFYVLDEHDRLVPAGSVGQLHIAGIGLARGYVNKPDLTAEKFIPNPFGAGRLYRTGDSARMLPSGDTEILGRTDQQVKLRGFRVELGEIEAVLARTCNVAASAVALREDLPGHPKLVGYFVDHPGTTSAPRDLDTRLAERLPDYMIPSVWVRLAALPLSSNGKLDRAALPAPPDRSTAGRTYAEPRTEHEIALAKICSEVLNLSRIGVDDDIFALGADSIQLFKITARANRQGMPLLAKHFFKHRTLARIANHLETTIAPAPAEPVLHQARAKLTILKRPAPPLEPTGTGA